MSAREVFNALHQVQPEMFLEGQETGSRYICNPPVMDTDDDIAILVRNLRDAQTFLERFGYRIPRDAHASMDDDDFWVSMRPIRPAGQAHVHGEVNLILTDNPHYYDRFKLATKVAKKLNILNKDHRISLFETIFAMPYNLPRPAQAEPERDLVAEGFMRAVAEERQLGRQRLEAVLNGQVQWENANAPVVAR